MKTLHALCACLTLVTGCCSNGLELPPDDAGVDGPALMPDALAPDMQREWAVTSIEFRSDSCARCAWRAASR